MMMGSFSAGAARALRGKGGGGATLYFLAFCSWSPGGNATHTYPAGWTKINQWVGANPHGNGGRVQLSAAYRFADGSEGASINVSKSTGSASSYLIYKITGANPLSAPEVGGFNSAENATPNPPNVTPSWGLANQLFIPFFGHEGGGVVSSGPTNYTDLEYSNGGGDESGIFVARRQLAAASDDPGTFSLSGARRWVAQTAVIRPAGSFPVVTGSSKNTVTSGTSHTVTLP